MVFHTSQSAQDVVNVVITGRVWYIATILLLYDYCLTFSDEVHYVWHCRSFRGRLIFFMNRYWPIACTVCHFFFQWASYSTIPVSITLGVILISKLHAMYGCNRKLLAVMCGFFVLDIVVTAAVGGTATHKMRAITVAGHTGCLPVNDYSYAWAYWVPSLGFEIILFVLALWKAVQEVRGDIRTPRLMVVLLRDSIFYFGAACTILLTNFFVWLFRVRRGFFYFRRQKHSLFRYSLRCLVLLFPWLPRAARLSAVGCWYGPGVLSLQRFCRTDSSCSHRPVAVNTVSDVQRDGGGDYSRDLIR
ncbi:hypothetical protein BKA93DRAFT_248733 [Sparassis latifolia]